MKYIFAIDETGNFSFDEKANSYVCGVLISKSENELKQKYKEAYQSFFPNRLVPDTKEQLIGKEQEHFHFAKLFNNQKEICKTELLPLANKIYISSGKPLLFANNQNYWQIAVTAVITQLLKQQKFDRDDALEIQIDFRADKVWGTINETSPDFLAYHNILKNQFELIIKPYKDTLNIPISILFASDTSSFFVNLADIVCGIVKQHKEVNSIKCPCEKVMGNSNPALLIANNPLAALVTIFQELLNNGVSNNTALMSTILERCRKEQNLYNQVWEIFYSFLKFQIKERFENNHFSKLNEINSLFLKEFNRNFQKINSDKTLDIATLFVEFASHNGEHILPFSNDFFLNILNDNHNESRILRKWEKWISYELRSAQILFNSYEFDTIESRFESLWNQQESIIKSIPFAEIKDEHTTAIIGTLAQSYAYKGKMDKAIEYFELSLEYATRSNAQAYFYLLTCHLLKQDIPKVYHYFELHTLTKAQDFQNKKEKNIWSLLAYAKLRALELYTNGSSNLPEIISNEVEPNSYPYPLLLKWQALALILENKTENKERIISLLTQALETLLQDRNGFTIQTLSIPIIQLFALIDNTNPYHAQYSRLIREWSEQSLPFKGFIENSDFLQSLKNDKDAWYRAISLPFIYS